MYPQVCGGCECINAKPLCNKCKVKLTNEFKFCIDDYSNDNTKNFTEHYYFFKYENLIRKLLLDLKFHEKPYIYKTISLILKNNEKCFKKLKKYDIIIIVPISKKRMKERGYNQSELIASVISKIAKAKIVRKSLVKIKNNIPQSSLNKIQREENAKGVYKVLDCSKLKEKNILIIDDIYTTGSTVNECAKVLNQVGIDRNQISVLTIAKD